MAFAGSTRRPAGRCRLIVAGLVGLGCAATGAAVAADPSISILTTLPQPMMANLGDEYRSIRLGADRDAFERAVEALGEHHDIDIHDMPLREAVALIADKAGIAIGFDHESLHDSGLDVDEASVTGRFQDASLRAVLRELLRDVDLAVVFRNERLVVTTADEAGRHAATFFYPVLAGTDVDELAALIERTVAPESWDTVGGPGAIMPVPGQMGTGLVIRQTEAVHEEIAGLVAGLDAALWSADEVDDGVVPLFVRAYAVPDPVVREKAAERLADICNAALPHGADPEAAVEVVGDSLVVRSKSRPFQVMAAQVLASLQGVDTILVEDEPADPADPDAAPDEDHATRYRKTAWPPAPSGGR